MKKFKIITISAILFLILGYFLINNIRIIKNYIPNSTKQFLKETVFVHQNQKLLKQQIETVRLERKRQTDNKRKKMLAIMKGMLLIEFFKSDETTKHAFGATNLLVTKFTQPIFTDLGPEAYFEYYNQNLFIISAAGNLMFSTLEQVKQNKFVFKKIDTNLIDIMGTTLSDPVKHLLIVNDKIYVSYLRKNENCIDNSILFSDLNLKKMIFKEFFSTNECQPDYTDQGGGNLSKYKNNNILFTIGDHKSSKLREDLPQNINSFLGKVIKINTVNKEYEIISMGHRNNQGIYYEEEEDVIYLTEHGPQKGDEININVNPGGEIENYGWAVSSYGEHYGFPADTDVLREMYKKAPLNKSHKKYGFIEPIKDFKETVAPTQIIKNDKFINNDNKKTIYVTSLMTGSVYQLLLNSDFSVQEQNSIAFGERIRDMAYIEEINKILLFLESSGSIIVLENL